MEHGGTWNKPIDIQERGHFFKSRWTCSHQGVYENCEGIGNNLC